MVLFFIAFLKLSVGGESRRAQACWRVMLRQWRRANVPTVKMRTVALRRCSMKLRGGEDQRNWERMVMSAVRPQQWYRHEGSDGVMRGFVGCDDILLRR